MSRIERPVLVQVVLVALLAAGALVSVSSPVGVAEVSDAADPRPNIILISSDDQRAADMVAMEATRRLLGGRARRSTMLMPRSRCAARRGPRF